MSNDRLWKPRVGTWLMSEDIERGQSLETTQQLAWLVRNKIGNVVLNMVCRWIIDVITNRRAYDSGMTKPNGQRLYQIWDSCSEIWGHTILVLCLPRQETNAASGPLIITNGPELKFVYGLMRLKDWDKVDKREQVHGGNIGDRNLNACMTVCRCLGVRRCREGGGRVDEEKLR